MVCWCIPFLCYCCCMKPSTGVCFTRLPFFYSFFSALRFLCRQIFWFFLFSFSGAGLAHSHRETTSRKRAQTSKGHRRHRGVIGAISWLRLPAALCFPLPFGLIQSAGDGQSLWGAAWFKTPCCLSNMLCENWIAPNTFYKLEWPRLFISSHPQPADVKSKCY